MFCCKVPNLRFQDNWCDVLKWRVLCYHCRGTNGQFYWGLDNLRASVPCEADVRGTLVSLKSTPVSLNSTPVSLNSSPVSLTVSIYVGGCSCLACLACFVHALHVCLACLACFVHASHVCLACLACLAGSHIVHTRFILCTGVIIYNKLKLDNYLVVSAGRQTFWGFEMK